MKDLPPIVMHDGADVLLYSPIDARHTHTGNAHHIVNGVLLGAASFLIIYRCGAGDETAYYLLGHNPQWHTDQTTLTRHATLEEAQAQGEFEYAGVSPTWEPVQSLRADFDRAMAKVPSLAPDEQDRL